MFANKDQPFINSYFDCHYTAGNFKPENKNRLSRVTSSLFAIIKYTNLQLSYT